MAIIDGRSFKRRTQRPPWERGNAYHAPNVYERSIGLGAIETFDCDPNGGEQADGAGEAEEAEPPCFVAPPHMFQDQKFPRLRRGKVPQNVTPEGREGNSPATP